MPESHKTFLNNLIEMINSYFNKEEFLYLCLDLDIRYDDLPGEGLAAQVREFVLHLARRERLPELTRLLREKRPRVAWPDVPANFKPPAESLSPLLSRGDVYNIGNIEAGAVGMGSTHIDIEQLQVNFQTQTNQPTGKRTISDPVNLPDTLPSVATQLQARVEALRDKVAVIMVDPQAAAELSRQLHQLGEELADVPTDHCRDAEKVVNSLESLAQQLTRTNPDRDLIEMYLKGFTGAVEKIADVRPTALRSAEKIASLLHT